MGFFSKIKSIFHPRDLELDFDLTKAKSVQELLDSMEVNQDDYIEKEKLVEEYDELTKIITDLQKLERIPKTAKNDIFEMAKRLREIQVQRKSFQEKSTNSPEKRLKYILQNESTVKEDIKKIRELEEKQLTLKTDINYLEGERGELAYSKQHVQYKTKIVHTFSIFSFSLIALVLILLMVLIREGMDITIPSILLLLYGFVTVVIVFHNRRKTELDLKTIAMKQKRAIELQDKIKIKYVNTTTLLEYLFEKYHVSSTHDLLHQYQQYCNYSTELKQYKNTSENILKLEENFDQQLQRYGIPQGTLLRHNLDALVSNKTLGELIDEYVELRNKRRQQLESMQD